MMIARYLWTLQCPGQPPKTYTELNPVLTAGPSPSESIDTTGATKNITCNMTLAVTDAANRTTTSKTTVTVR